MDYLRSISDIGFVKKLVERHSRNSITLIVGAGSRENALLVKDNSNLIVGIDICLAGLRKAKELKSGNLYLIQADAEKLPLRDGSIDLSCVQLPFINSIEVLFEE